MAGLDYWHVHFDSYPGDAIVKLLLVEVRKCQGRSRGFGIGVTIDKNIISRDGRCVCHNDRV